MLKICIDILINELNSFMKLRIAAKENIVTYANLAISFQENKKNSGSKLLISVADIVNEDLESRAEEYIPQGGGYIVKPPPIKLSLYLLIAVSKNTVMELEGLSYLSQVVAFFQSKNYFDAHNTPALQEAGLDNLLVELEKLEYMETQALWRKLGIHYVPSLLYKVSTIPIEDTNVVTNKVPTLKGASSVLNTR